MTAPEITEPPEGEEEVTVTVTETETETRTVRYLTNRGEGDHILEATPAPVDLSGSEPTPAAEADRPQTTGMGADYTYSSGNQDEVDHEVDWSGLHDKEVPRHDRYAAENTGVIPQRVIPGGITNAHPDYTVGPAVDPTQPVDTAVATSAPIPDDAVVKESTGTAVPEDEASSQLTDKGKNIAAPLPPVVSPEPVVTGPTTTAVDIGGTPQRQVVQTEPDPPQPPGKVPDGTVLTSVGDADTTPPLPQDGAQQQDANPPGIVDGKSVPAGEATVEVDRGPNPNPDQPPAVVATGTATVEGVATATPDASGQPGQAAEAPAGGSPPSSSEQPAPVPGPADIPHVPESPPTSESPSSAAPDGGTPAASPAVDPNAKADAGGVAPPAQPDPGPTQPETAPPPAAGG